MKHLISYMCMITLLSVAAVPLAAQENQEKGNGGDTSSLMQAYQKEFVFLDNEIRLLKKRIDEVERDGEQRVSQARRELRVLEAELLDLQSQVEKKNEELRMLEEERGSTEDAVSTVSSIIEQGNKRLGEFGMAGFSEARPEEAKRLKGEEKTAAKVSYVMEKSLALLDELGEVREEQTKFFLPDGKQTEGEVIHLGRIASFGLSEEGAGTLAPAGEGMLKLVKSVTRDTAKALAKGNMPEELPMYLYESADSAAETTEEKSFMDTVRGGGIIGVIILGMGAVALILIVLRAAYLYAASRRDTKLEQEAARHVQQGEYEKAIEKSAKIPGPMGRVLSSTVKGIKLAPHKVEDTISEVVLNEQPPLERFRTAISVFAAVAPLLGLLGTVTGMISTFDVITIHGTGDPKLLSGGISQALITTELGLSVAIPTLLIGNLLSTWSDRITSNMEVAALRLTNIAGGFEGSETKGE